jgi:hypothetical protein
VRGDEEGEFWPGGWDPRAPETTITASSMGYAESEVLSAADRALVAKAEQDDRYRYLDRGFSIGFGTYQPPSRTVRQNRRSR